MSSKESEGTLGKWLLAGFGLWAAYSWGNVEGRRESSASSYSAQADQSYGVADVIETYPNDPAETEEAPSPEALQDAAELASVQTEPEASAYAQPTYADPAPAYRESTAEQDARFKAMYQSWAANDQARKEAVSDVATADTVPSNAPRAAVAGSVAGPRVSSGQAYSYTPAVPIYSPPPATTRRYGCAENGTCYGEISANTGKPKTVHVPGYYRSDGKYVKGHYKSR